MPISVLCHMPPPYGLDLSWWCGPCLLSWVPGVISPTTPIIGKMKCPRLYLCHAHSIPSPPMLMQHMHQPITNDMIHFISSCDHIGSSILTSLALHHCFSPSSPSHHSTCPSHLQSVHRAKPCLDLFHLDHMTQC